MTAYRGYFERALEKLYQMLAEAENDTDRREYIKLIDNVERGLVEVEDAIREAKNIGVRHPDFDGDMVGWPEDDFDDEAEEEDDEAL
jgi:hypothetical protein